MEEGEFFSEEDLVPLPSKRTREEVIDDDKREEDIEEEDGAGDCGFTKEALPLL